jgi:hypothetical protein
MDLLHGILPLSNDLLRAEAVAKPNYGMGENFISSDVRSAFADLIAAYLVWVKHNASFKRNVFSIGQNYIVTSRDYK